MNALTYENPIHRNQLAHCHEMVVARRQWWDEKVFNDYPSWNEAVEDRVGYFGDQSPKNRALVLNKLESWFGKAHENGPSNYAKSCNYGIGYTALANMLKLFPYEVEEALRALPLTPRARQGLELRSQEAERLANDPSPEGQARKKKAEDNAKVANARASRDQEMIKRRDWYDARASEVFDRAAHGRAFRERVSTPEVRAFLPTEVLVPFAKAIRERLEQAEGVSGMEFLTAANIRREIADNYRIFRATLRLKEREAIQREERDHPVMTLKKRVEAATEAMRSCRGALMDVITAVHRAQATATHFGGQEGQTSRQIQPEGLTDRAFSISFSPSLFPSLSSCFDSPDP